jgi:hypothetical protein
MAEEQKVVYIQAPTQEHSTIANIAGLAVGLCVGVATKGMLDGMLPEAVTTFEKVVRYGALYGASTAAAKLTSDAVTESVDSMMTIPLNVLSAYNSSSDAVAQISK